MNDASGLEVGVWADLVRPTVSARPVAIRVHPSQSATPTAAACVAAVRAAAAQMVAGLLLLPQDAGRAIELATQDRLLQLH